MFKAKITVKSFVVKECPRFKVGRSWIVEYGMTPDDYFCASFWPRVQNALDIMSRSPKIEFMDIHCGDAEKIMIYEVRRIALNKEGNSKGNKDAAG
jgi:uncharacterized repeat protein (TIGR04076 family)